MNYSNDELKKLFKLSYCSDFKFSISPTDSQDLDLSTLLEDHNNQLLKTKEILSSHDSYLFATKEDTIEDLIHQIDQEINFYTSMYQHGIFHKFKSTNKEINFRVDKLNILKDHIKKNLDSTISYSPIEDDIFIGPKLFDDDHVFFLLNVNSDLSFNVFKMNILDKGLQTNSAKLNSYYGSYSGDFFVQYTLRSVCGTITEEFTDHVDFDYKSLSTAINHKLFTSEVELIEFVSQASLNINRIKESL